MFDTSRERPTTHDPGLHVEFVTAVLSHYYRNLSKWPVLILIRSSEKKSGRVAKVAQPFRFTKPFTVEIELIRLVDQLKRSHIAAHSDAIKDNRRFGTL